jgi:signal recognition particle subunit SRP19
MSHHARIEEVSDSDPDEVAPADLMDEDSIIERASIPIRSNQAPAAPTPMAPSMAQQMPEPQREIPRHFQCIYPIYFDKTRSRGEGRKVGSELAVENPLARDIMDAVQMVGLQAGLEPEKLHPKDWANPGRVRVHLKNEDGRLLNPKVKNSEFLNLLEDRSDLRIAVGCDQLVFHCMTNLRFSQSTTSTSSSPNI